MIASLWSDAFAGHWLPEQVVRDLPLFLVLGSISAGLSTMAKSGFGGGIGMLATPLMVLACGEDARLALGVMLPMLVVSDYVILVQWWRKWNTKAAMSLLPGSIAGMILGWVILQYVFGAGAGRGGALAAGMSQDRANGWMMLAIGAIALGFVALHVLRSMRAHPLPFRPVLPATARHVAVPGWQATSVGVAAGVTSTLAHAAGPIVTMYLLPQGMPKTRFVATTALYYWCGNQLKLVPYFFLGMISLQTLGANIVLMPSVAVGAVLGVWLHHRLGERNFTLAVYGLLALAGIDLIYRAAGKLF